jgi:hypothetical protein
MSKTYDKLVQNNLQCSKIKNSENIQIFITKISTRFLLLKKWCKLVFPYLTSVRYPKRKTFPVLLNQSYREAIKNVPYGKLYQKVHFQTSLNFFNVHGSVHRNNILVYNPN